MSTGELRVDGPTAVYELRMPMYEVAHIANPSTLIDHIRFGDAQRTRVKCQEENGEYVCIANYEFPRLLNRLDVECTFFQITVPNHVHILTAIQGPFRDQAVFDQSFPRAEIRFRPPSRFEIVARELGYGFWHAIATPAVLFLFALVLAARSARETAILAVMYLAGEWIMRLIAPRIPWPLSPRFIEAAIALTIAYLALEILLLPKAANRWVVVLVLGLFHGLYFAAFPATYLIAAAIFQVAAIAILAWCALRFATPAIRRVSTVALLAVSAAWFAWRLIVKA